MHSGMDGVFQEFGRYVAILNIKGIEHDKDAAQEVKDRLWQAEYALSQLDTYISKYIAAARPTGQSVGEYTTQFLSSTEDLFSKGVFYAESFYYFAFRAYKIMRGGEKSLPGLSSFSCPGVIVARNHLIEHPEGASSNAVIYSYSFDEQKGALLRTSGSPDQKKKDNGSVYNSNEFGKNLMAKIQAAISDFKSR